MGESQHASVKRAKVPTRSAKEAADLKYLAGSPYFSGLRALVKQRAEELIGDAHAYEAEAERAAPLIQVGPLQKF